jgi:hypothetical protein
MPVLVRRVILEWSTKAGLEHAAGGGDAWSCLAVWADVAEVIIYPVWDTAARSSFSGQALIIAWFEPFVAASTRSASAFAWHLLDKALN